MISTLIPVNQDGFSLSRKAKKKKKQMPFQMELVSKSVKNTTDGYFCILSGFISKFVQKASEIKPLEVKKSKTEQ